MNNPRTPTEPRTPVDYASDRTDPRTGQAATPDPYRPDTHRAVHPAGGSGSSALWWIVGGGIAVLALVLLLTTGNRTTAPGPDPVGVTPEATQPLGGTETTPGIAPDAGTAPAGEAPISPAPPVEGTAPEGAAPLDAPEAAPVEPAPSGN
jgi:hypothetical protein